MSATDQDEVIISHNYWRVPSVERAFSGILEGNPSEEERQQIIEEATTARKAWKPSPQAFELVEKLKAYIGEKVRLQFWCTEMWWNEIEGAFPCEVNCMDVVVQTDGEFPQAFLVVSDVVEFPNDFGHHTTGYFLTRAGCVLAPVADLYSVTKVGSETK